MAEVRGKFVTLACDLIKTKPEARQEAMRRVQNLTGQGPYELDPEGWYDTKVLQSVFSAIRERAEGVMGWAAIKVIGQLVYPTIKTTVGLPSELKTPLDFVKFEAQGFLLNHRGAEVIPRKFVRETDNDIIVEAPSPGYDCDLIEGVFEGILHICGIGDGRVKQSQCVKKGDSTCVYHITWSGQKSYTGGVDWSTRGPA
jgi:predicted hydrocarbon binding protein